MADAALSSHSFLSPRLSRHCVQTSPKPQFPRLAQPLDSSSARRLTRAQIISVLEPSSSSQLQGEGWRGWYQFLFCSLWASQSLSFLLRECLCECPPPFPR